MSNRVSPRYLFPLEVWDGGATELIGEPLEYGPLDDFEPTGWEERKGFAELETAVQKGGGEYEIKGTEIISGDDGTDEIIGDDGMNEIVGDDGTDEIVGFDPQTLALLGLGGLAAYMFLQRGHPSGGAQTVVVPSAIPGGPAEAMSVPPEVEAPPGDGGGGDGGGGGGGGFTPPSPSAAAPSVPSAPSAPGTPVAPPAPGAPAAPPTPGVISMSSPTAARYATAISPTKISLDPATNTLNMNLPPELSAKQGQQALDWIAKNPQMVAAIKRNPDQALTSLPASVTKIADALTPAELATLPADVASRFSRLPNVTARAAFNARQLNLAKAAKVAGNVAMTGAKLPVAVVAGAGGSAMHVVGNLFDVLSNALRGRF